MLLFIVKFTVVTDVCTRIYNLLPYSVELNS